MSRDLFQDISLEGKGEVLPALN